MDKYEPGKYKDRDERLLRLVCDAVQPKSYSMRLLLERIRINEETKESSIVFAKNKWRSKQKSTESATNEEEKLLAKKLRRQRLIEKQAIFEKLEEETKQQEKMAPIEVFRIVARRVRLLIRVFRNMHQYAIEKGGHGSITTGAMQLKDSVNNGEEKNLLFNPNDYKCRYQFSIPLWARKTCAKESEHRSEHEVQNIVSLMRQLKGFRKYSNRMQTLLGRIVRYERFGRRRVVIRKGHVGMSFYMIFSGSVGVVVEGDEDRAFANEEKPANMLQKGDAFGEIALVRRSVRSATIVCLENTDFLVIDKEDFYKLGIDKCAEEEMLLRYNFMRNMDIFSTWNSEDLKEVAEGGRIVQFLTDQVIEMDTTETEFVYILAKGQCDVIRLLDLTTHNLEENNQQRNNYLKLRNPSPASSSGYEGSRMSSTNETLSYQNEVRKESSIDLPVYNESQCKMNKTKNKIRISPKLNISKGSNVFKNVHDSETNSLESIATTSMTITTRRSNPTTCNNCYLNSNKRQQQQQQRKHQQTMPRVFGKTRNLDQAFTGSNIGLGVLIKVDVLTQGQVFGLKSILHEDEQDTDCNRKFTLVSAGCDVIRVPKSVIKAYADQTMLQKIKHESFTYDTDWMLYKRFKRYNDWRCFREQLVDHIAQCDNQVEKSLKDRSKSIPRITRINDIANFIRPETPIEHWQRLVDDGCILKEDPPCSPPRYTISPIATTSNDNQTASLTSPFVQDKIMTAKGSVRRLVLTHGGSRANKIQLDTKCSLLQQKEINYKINKRIIQRVAMKYS